MPVLVVAFALVIADGTTCTFKSDLRHFLLKIDTTNVTAHGKQLFIRQFSTEDIEPRRHDADVIGRIAFRVIESVD